MVFKKLDDRATEPVRATADSAGLDIFALEDVTIEPFTTKVVRTGITFDLVHGEDGGEWFIDMRVRSSLAVKSVMLANGAGVIDKDYAGKEIMVLLYNGSRELLELSAGAKVAQMLIMAHYSFVAKGVTFKYTKRTGGLGSTGE